MNALISMTDQAPWENQRCGSSPPNEEAVNILAKAIVAATKALDPRDNITVAQVVEKFLRYCWDDVSPHHRQERTKRLRDFCALHGHKRIEECSPLDLQEFVERPSWKSNHTRDNARGHILRCFNWAHKSQLIRENSLFGCPKTPSEASGRPMTDEVFWAIMRNVTAEFRRVLIFLRFTSCRPSEAFALRWENINWEKSIAVLPNHKTAKKTGEPRTLYLLPVVIKLLRWMARCNQQELAAHWLARVLKKGPIKSRDLAALARQRSYTKRQVYRAIRTLGVSFDWVRVPGSEADRRSRHHTVKRKLYSLVGEPCLPKGDSHQEIVFLNKKQRAWTRRSFNLRVFRLYKAGHLPSRANVYGCGIGEKRRQSKPACPS